MKMFILMSIYVLTMGSPLYLVFGKARGKPVVPVKALWLFDLIEKTFKQNNSSTKEVRENELS
jgi:hypothetical protein